MTTNFTAILNANLDQIDGYDYPTNMIVIENGDVVYADEYFFDGERWCSWDAYYEAEAKWEDEARECLTSLQHRMDDIIFRCGVYGADEWAELASIYSDVHKDIYGYRPYGIGLRYHGITA